MFSLIIADDEEIIRQGLLTIQWEKRDIELLGIGSNGNEAIQLIRETQPDIVLTDIRMPGLDGIELARIIRSEFPQTKVILLTAHHDFEYARSAIQIGVTDFILKPANEEEILSVMDHAIKEIEVEMERENREHRLVNLVREYQLRLKKQIIPDQEKLYSEHVKLAISFIEQRYMDNLSIATIADYVHLNPIYLSRLFKKETGETVLDILTRTRMHCAYELMSDVNLKLYEIAEQVGIPDSRYFGQLFKKCFGITPSTLRQQLRQDDNHEELE
jgi:two-component system response regulator YesN